jgi:predicted nucleic acid-binding protein
VRLFLDTSVLLAASGSAAGASHRVCHSAHANGWSLVVTPYVVDEVTRNLPRVPTPTAPATWAALRPMLIVMPDVFTVDRPAVFGPAKDRPILFAALAWADVLLTLDQGDFGGLFGVGFYGLRVLRPGTFLEEERAAGRLR